MKRRRGGQTGGPIRWPLLYVGIGLSAIILVVSTVLWTGSTQHASEQTVNDLVKFYLEEIAERNAGNITTELDRKAEQLELALTVLDESYLQSEQSIRGYISMVQRINGLDMFALADEEGMVYTAESTFSGISRFGFLSEKITQTSIHMVSSYGTRTKIIIAAPRSDARRNFHCQRLYGDEYRKHHFRVAAAESGKQNLLPPVYPGG